MTTAETIARQRNITIGQAAALIEAAHPLWLALEDVGFVDGHGGSEFDRIFPETIEAIHRLANPLAHGPRLADEQPWAKAARSIGEDMLRWAGLVNDDGAMTGAIDEAEQFAEIVQHSSIPEACELVRDGMKPIDRCEACGSDRGDGYCQECPNDPDRPEE